jgi:hypothetical protein
MSRSIFTRASSALSRANSICSVLTGRSPAPCSPPFSDAGGCPDPVAQRGLGNAQHPRRHRRVLLALDQPHRLASSLYSSVYRALRPLSSCLLVSRAPCLRFHHQLCTTFFWGKVTRAPTSSSGYANAGFCQSCPW